MSYLLNLSSRLKAAKATLPTPVPAPAPAPEPVAAVAVVEVPVVAPEPFLSVSESVEPAPQSTSLVDLVEEAVTEAPSEEQYASPPAPASTASSHTESSS